LISVKPIIYEGQGTQRTMNVCDSAHSEGINTEKTIYQADQRLYIAKNSGRKKVAWEDA
jgi:PleD family two-component response regulator